MLIRLARVLLAVTVVSVFHDLSPSLACILLLNGWTPMSVEKRTELADIVAIAHTRRTFKEVRTPEANTYTAEFRFVNVLKGTAHLDEMGSTSRRVYNVSNFGDRAMCYADVNRGDTYIIFLTVFDSRLSAKYDDIFGAVAEYDRENEAAVLKSLGWKHWSGWGGCSVTCGGGRQTRRRRCMNKTCEGTARMRRSCNTFYCRGIVDLLQTLAKDQLIAVEKHARQPRAAVYRLDHKSRIRAPTSRLFTHTFPRDFSILVTARPKKNSDGFVFTISNLMGFVNLGVAVGSRVTFEYDVDTPFHSSPPSSSLVATSGDHSRNDGALTFRYNLADGDWHQFSFSVVGARVTFFADCVRRGSALARRITAGSRISVKTVTSLGGSFIESKRYPNFEGEIAQLLIIPNAEAAEMQCTKSGRRKKKRTDLRGITEDMPSKYPAYDEKETAPAFRPDQESPIDRPVVMFWSAWSPCGVSCGQGQQIRIALCPSADAKHHSVWRPCSESSYVASQVRQCDAGACAPRCPFYCYNHGTCMDSGQCSCQKGYYGRMCESVSCVPSCYHGGYCMEPNVCTCAPGYTGTQCETALCEPVCENGGRCMRPGICACPYGLLPPICQPLCSRGCANNGKCVAPDTCLCRAGYSGKTCTEPVCKPSCLNGGSCVHPYTCLCVPGTYGPACEHFVCSEACRNGGTCIGLNTCACLGGFYGKQCQYALSCVGRCKNGGRCVVPDICICKTGYNGPRCERRKCSWRVRRYRTAHRMLDTRTRVYACGMTGFRLCFTNQPTYRLVYRIHYRKVHVCS